jgi:MerR family transcriptional regulator/heat shock protein HspR
MRSRQRRPRATPAPGSRANRRTIELHLISSAAELLNMHPQTLRKYERLGLVQPLRTLGSMRVYSADELARLRLIKFLVDEAGINLAGVQRLLSIAEVAGRLRPLVVEQRAHRDAREERATSHAEFYRRLATEIDEIFRILGLDTASRS